MNIPNKITLLRILFIPCFVVLFYCATEFNDFIFYIPCLCISLLQELTDMIDGILARRRKEITDIGKIFDPFADLMSHFTAFLCLLYGRFIPLWAVVIIFWREIFIYTLRILLAKKNIVLAARFSGKIKALVQGGAINLILFSIVLGGYFKDFPLAPVDTVIISIAVAVTLWSWIDYIKITGQILRET
jgi:CDP-diacylglycerol--glycerol-3-phosphate 3-phosphatidyltransferase